MLHVYQSNHLETLGQVLAERLTQRPAGQSLFCAETIVVQNPDMAQWLKIQLAGQLGIAANLDFPLPSSYLWTLFRLLVADKVAEQSPFDKANMRWALMKLLPAQLDAVEFAPLKHYLAHIHEGVEPQAARQLRLYQLCNQIADVFDQYLMYRPEWLTEWEAGADGEGGEPAGGAQAGATGHRGQPLGLNRCEVDADNRWQPILWRLLCTFIKDNAQIPFHRSDLFRASIEALARVPQAQLPKRLFIFGLTTMPRPMLQLFTAMSQRCDLHLLLLNPCREFWADIVSAKNKVQLELKLGGQEQYLTVGNPLLASMGQLCRDFHELVIDETSQVAVRNWEGYQAPDSTSMLGLLQGEVLNLSCRQQMDALSAEQLLSNVGKLTVPADDNSIQLHRCYTPLREVEVLHDQLLRLFAADPDLAPKDIVVMTPDIERYAPYIEAVFAGQPRPQRIPHAINDLGAVQEAPILQSLLQMLRLPESRLGLSEVLGLLEIPATLTRFGLSDEEFVALKSWLADAGVRWGRDAAHRLDFGLPAFEQNSWAFGLKRLLLGYAMTSDAGLFQSTLPFDGIEGKQAESLGKFLMFVDQLDHYRRCFDQFLTIEDWQQQVSALLAALYQPDADETLALNRASIALETLRQRLKQIGWQQPLPRQVVLAYLSEVLDSPAGNGRFLAGAVNFCTLMPMRSIPFKVVCLLGMNDGEFPRNVRPVGFDLMAGGYRKGDRSRRLDDRYLFLEALLSARQKLSISYLGRNVRDDKELAPSVLVSEVVDYLKQACVPAGMEAATVDDGDRALETQLTTAHPLQPYNARYFDGSDPGLFTYSRVWEQVHAPANIGPFINQPLADYFAADHPPHTVNIGQLAGFLVNPCKQFMQRRLGVYLHEQETLCEDRENFALDALSAWKLKDDYIGLQAQRAATGLDPSAENDLFAGDQSPQATAAQATVIQATAAQADEQWARHLAAEGHLPVLHHGRLVLTGLQQSCRPMINALGVWLSRPTQKLPVEVDLDDWRLGGEIDGMIRLEDSAEGPDWVRRVIKAGSTKPKDLLRAWVAHLALHSQGLSVRTLLFSEKEVHQLPPLPVEQAQAYLLALLALYRRGLCEPLPFFPETSSALIKAWQKLDLGDSTSAVNASKENALDALCAETIASLQHAVLAVWQPTFQNGAPPESADLYNQRCFVDLLAAWQPFVAHAMAILAPLSGHLSRQTLKQFQASEAAL